MCTNLDVNNKIWDHLFLDDIIIKLRMVFTWLYYLFWKIVDQGNKDINQKTTLRLT